MFYFLNLLTEIAVALFFSQGTVPFHWYFFNLQIKLIYDCGHVSKERYADMLKFLFQLAKVS